MLYSELKVGMLVKANKRSNRKYGATTEEKGCIGRVKKVGLGGAFTIQITQHCHALGIGKNYDVDCRYFDIYEEGKVENKMKIELKEADKGLDFEVGDVLVYEDDTCVLVCDDYTSVGYRGVILGENYVTKCRGSKETLLEEIEEEEGFGRMVRVIKAPHLKLTEI